MDFVKIINETLAAKDLSATFIEHFENDSAFRKRILEHIEKHPNRAFTLRLLDRLTQKRRNGEGISGDSLMLAAFMLGKHGHIEDCVAIWNAKSVDFDAYCYVDIQLVVFGGVSATLAYLETVPSETTKQMKEYILECNKGGDFNNLETYFSTTPWFL